MSTLLLVLSGFSALMGVLSFFRPRYGLFFIDPARRTPGKGVRFWLFIDMLFWGAFRLFYNPNIHVFELSAVFALAVLASDFCRRSLSLPALRKKKSLYAHGVIGCLFGLAMQPFLQGNMDHIVQEYKWKFIVILIPALLLALLYDLLTSKFFGFLSRLFGTLRCDSLKDAVFSSFSQLLGALVNAMLILAGMLVAIVLLTAISDGRFAPYLLPPLLMLYCCLMMSDIITRILGGEFHK